mgnify:CR=1 FL=1
MVATKETVLMERILDKTEALTSWMRHSGLHPEIHRQLSFHLEALRDDAVALNGLLLASAKSANEFQVAKNAQVQQQKTKPVFTK